PKGVGLGDLVDDNPTVMTLAESASLLIGRDFGIGTDIRTGPNGNVYVVSLSDGAVYEIFRKAARPLPGGAGTAPAEAVALLSRPEARPAAFSTAAVGAALPAAVGNAETPFRRAAAEAAGPVPAGRPEESADYFVDDLRLPVLQQVDYRQLVGSFE